jgi:hypothetical protein
MKYEVIDPKGITCNGKRIASGEVVPLPDGAALKAFLHFKQVIPREGKKPIADPGEKEPARTDPVPEKPAEDPPQKEPAKPKK